MCGARSALDKTEDASMLFFQFLGGQTIEGWGAHAGGAASDGVGRMVKKDGLESTGISLERQYGKFRVKGARRTHEIIHRSDPVNRVIREEQPAVCPDTIFLPQ